MTPLFALFAVLLMGAQLKLPKRYAFLPLIVTSCHLSNLQFAGGFTVIRVLLILGLGRAKAGGYLQWSRKEPLDVIMLFFSVWLLLSWVGHEASDYTPNPFAYRAGVVLNLFGSYLYARAYFSDLPAYRNFLRILPFVLAPLAIEMLIEQRTGRNLYSVLGAANTGSVFREGHIRAIGPFRHPILAGCAGATALPFAFLLWRMGEKKTAILAFGACMGITMGSASSGPLAAVAITGAGIIFWPHRRHLSKVLWAIAFICVAFTVVKGHPPWYIMASIDLVGGSTGWHRAYLIDQGILHLDEWWLMGTDYTRHWMPTGVTWSPNMIDITNYYLHLGVIGGVFVTLCLMLMILLAFRILVRNMAALRPFRSLEQYEFCLWCVATSLACHAASFVSISYYDQMFVAFFLLLGSIPMLQKNARQQILDATRVETEPSEGSASKVYAQV